jgi:ABC-type glycerol-3-phosphate transport system substrate-binding protein
MARRVRGIPLLFALVLLLAACGGSGKSNSPVLTSSDVGKAFTQFDKGKQVEADFSPPRNKPDRFGRKDGWKARFSRPGNPKTEGPLVISSLADEFSSASGAHKDFELYRQTLALFASTNGRTLTAPALGDESAAVTYRQGLPPNTVRYYVIAWRHGSVTASVNVYGFEGRITWEQALDLARKQEKAISKSS